MAELRSPAFSISEAVVGTAPAWFTNTAFLPGTWTTIAGGSGQKISDVLPSPYPQSLSGGPYAITAAYCGGGVDQTRKEYILCANGGHGDGGDNSAYALTLSAATPAWRRLSNPTPDANMGNINLESGGIFADGRPRAMHSTNEVYGDGRVWFPMLSSVSSGQGGHADKIFSYNRDSLGTAATPLAWTSANLGPWTYHGTASGGTAGFGNFYGFSMGAFDRVNHKVHAVGNSNDSSGVAYWNFATQGASIGITTNPRVDGLYVKPSWMVCAHDLGICVIAHSGQGTPSTAIVVLDVATRTLTRKTVGAGGNYGATGAVYVEANHSILIGDPLSLGGQIYKLSIPMTGSAYNPSGTFTWTSFNPGGTPPTFPASFHNAQPDGKPAHSKWNIVEDMGNGQSAIVYAPNYTGATYVYKIPVGGL